MLTLFLDTASSQPLLALCDERRTLALRGLPGAKDHALIPALDAALADARVKREALARIACAIGPGGFTSLRVGVTAANVLTHTLGLPLVGIHLSDLWATRVPPKPPLRPNHGSTFLWLHSTRRNALFVRGFGAFVEKFPEATLVTLEEAITLEGIYVGELLEEHQKALLRCTPITPADIHPLEEILPQFLGSLPYRKEQVLPWYGRAA